VPDKRYCLLEELVLRMPDCPDAPTHRPRVTPLASHRLDPYLAKWDLIADGELILTASSHLLPVRVAGAAAMLKMSADPQERVGASLMEWWNGKGAARILAADGEALLMERATGPRSLAAMSRTGNDAEACRVLCAVASQLGTARSNPLPQLTPLESRFRDLGPAATRYGGIMNRSAATAQLLLSAPRDVAVLHGDLHHDNVLDFGSRGWLAIDPKGLIGERCFDYANIFCNPDLSDPIPPVATLPHVFASRLALIADLAAVDRERLLFWIMAWAGLSAAWIIDSGAAPTTSLTMMQLAAAELDR
jgi:streptomycin 6-kinase